MAGGHLFRAICRQPQQDNGHLCGHFSAGGRGIWRATTRPVCTWPPAQRTAAIHVGTVSGSYSFLPFAFIFHVPFFIFPPFLHSLISLSLSLQSSTLNPSPFFPPLLWFFHPPLRSRRSFYLWWIAVELPVALAGPMEQQPLRGEKTEGGDEGTSGGGETVNHPVDICARITRKARDSFEAIFPTSAQLLYSYSSSSRDSMSRGRKKGLKATKRVSNYDNASGELYHSARNILRNFKFDGVNKIEARSRLKEIMKF